MSVYSLERFNMALNELKIDLSEKQMSQFIKFYDMMIERNKVMNLTGITEWEEVVEKHFIDSLLVSKKMDFNKSITVIDVGTGAGFPGIPLKIAFPNIKIVLLDSLKKRIRFLNEVIEDLSLDDISTVHGRAEDISKKVEFRESFDLCISRAVANLAVLSEYCLPFVTVGGQFVPYKSVQLDEEIDQSKRSIKILGGSIKENWVTNIPNTDMTRAFLFVDKVKSTNLMYPRKAGIPLKNPL